MQGFRLKGKYHLKLTRQGKIVYEHETENIITQACEALVALRMFYSGVPPAAPQHLAFGTGGQAAAKTQVALVAEFAVARFLPNVGSHTTLNSIQLSYIVNPPVPMNAVAEVGVFNAATGGTMCSRAVINVFSMAPPDVLNVFWTIQFLGID